MNGAKLKLRLPNLDHTDRPKKRFRSRSKKQDSTQVDNRQVTSFDSLAPLAGYNE